MHSFLIGEFCLYYFDSLPSTNSWAKQYLQKHPICSPSCVYVDKQTQGRTTKKQAWVSSPEGGDLLMTLFFSIPSNHSFISYAGHMLAAAVVCYLQEQKIAISFKWPNDLLLEEKKIGGILVETFDLSSTSKGLCIGLGLNVGMQPALLATIDQKASSLSVYTNRAWDMQRLREEILRSFRSLWTRASKEGIGCIYSLLLTGPIEKKS